MIFRDTPIDGVRLIEPERHMDDRGHFARTWCVEECAENGIRADVVQCNTSFNHRRGTLRGMHIQAPPHGEAKLVRCTRGRMWDVVVDMRPDSPTPGAWWGTELSADNGHMMFIAEGIAHGFQTLEDDTEVFYQMSAEFHADASRGFRWDDPGVGIQWPLPEPTVISEKDAALPAWTEAMRDIQAASMTPA